MSKTVLELKNISVTFDGFKALQNVCLSVKEGDIHFLIGPNGAGKTTLLDIICGKTKALEGEIIFGDVKNMQNKKEHEIAALGIGRKFQNPSVFSNLTVFENMELFIKQDRGILYNLLNKIDNEKKEKILETLKTVSLLEHKDTLAGALSHGQKQWLEIAMLLVQDPKLLLLDEPVAGMGKSETEKTGQLLRKISKQCTVLIVEHDMEFMRKFATTVSVLHEGKNLCAGTVDEVQNDSRVLEVYIGRSDKSA